MNELEFPSIYEAFQPKIFRYLTRLFGEADAEDLTQEVLIKVSDALPNFRGESQLSTWIYRIATNTALDRLRSPSCKWVIQDCSVSDVNDFAKCMDGLVSHRFDLTTIVIEEKTGKQRINQHRT